jgi:hypothetical protein
MNHGMPQFLLNGPTGSQYVIQASSNLLTWSPISTNTIAEAETMLITDVGAVNQKQRFYRAVRQ